MRNAFPTVENLAELAPLPTLLIAYAPVRLRPWHRLCWLLDQRLAGVVRRAGDPTIAAIRLAWWDAVLVEDDRAKGGGEPMVEAWRALAPADAAVRTEQLIDGWRTLLSPEALTPDDLADFSCKRGGGLFGLLATGSSAGSGAETSGLPDDPTLTAAGASWALWDLAAHTRDAALARSAIDQARRGLEKAASLPRHRALKPLRLAHELARVDIAAGRVPAGGFEGRHYRRLLWRSLLG